MLNALKLQIPASPCKLQLNTHTHAVSFGPSITLRLPNRRRSSDFASLAVQTSSSELTSSVGYSPVIQQPPLLTQRHINVLSFFACVTAISATWLFCAAIPTLLAFKRAAESMEKLMDVAREEIPDTMAAVRLSGMEIGDLTMELSDLGQGITRGVQSSTRVVRMAEERLRQFTNSTPTVSVQTVAPIETENPKLALARSARGMREGIIKSRSVVQMVFSLTRFSKVLLNFLKSRTKA